MNAAGDLLKFFPGDSVPVTVTEDGSGNLAGRGDGVKLSGENADRTEVTLTEAQGDQGVGILDSDPDDNGHATLILLKPVIYTNPADAYDASVSDEVEFVADGEVDEYDPDTGATTPYGTVFRTFADSFDGAGKIMVAVNR